MTAGTGLGALLVVTGAVWLGGGGAAALTWQLAITTECAETGQSAARKVERLTKGEAGVFDEQANYWLPNTEPAPRPPVMVSAPCLS